MRQANRRVAATSHQTRPGSCRRRRALREGRAPSRSTTRESAPRTLPGSAPTSARFRAVARIDPDHPDGGRLVAPARRPRAPRPRPACARSPGRTHRRRRPCSSTPPAAGAGAGDRSGRRRPSATARPGASAARRWRRSRPLGRAGGPAPGSRGARRRPSRRSIPLERDDERSIECAVRSAASASSVSPPPMPALRSADRRLAEANAIAELLLGRGACGVAPPAPRRRRGPAARGCVARRRRRGGSGCGST